MIAETAFVQVAMLQGLLGCQPLVRVPTQELEQEFTRIVVLGYLIDDRGVSRLDGSILSDISSRCVACGTYFVKSRRSQYVNDLVDLFERIGGQEENLAIEELAINASD